MGRVKGREGEEGVELGIGQEKGPLEFGLGVVVALLLHLIAVIAVAVVRLLLGSPPVFAPVICIILKSTISADLVLLPKATFPLLFLAHPEIIHHFER